VLQVKQAPDPTPNPSEVRIRVEASGVNFADIMGRMGVYPDLPPIPVVPGYEVSGRIDAVGLGVDQSWIGRDVIAMTRFGGYADVVCVPVKQVFPRPAGLSALDGAAIPVNYFTAWQLVVVMGALKANETVLIHSAGGGALDADADLAGLGRGIGGFFDLQHFRRAGTCNPNLSHGVEERIKVSRSGPLRFRCARCRRPDRNRGRAEPQSPQSRVRRGLRRRWLAAEHRL
jgi:hypothetical protein